MYDVTTSSWHETTYYLTYIIIIVLYYYLDTDVGSPYKTERGGLGVAQWGQLTGIREQRQIAAEASSGRELE